MAQTLGVVDIVWRGQKVPVEKGAKLKLGGLKNNVVTMADGVDRAQEFEPSEVTATTSLRRGQRLSDLFGTAEGELQVRCDTGQTFVWFDAFVTNRPEATGGEGGKVEIKWSGGEPEEIL